MSKNQVFPGELKIFSGTSNKPLAQAIANFLNIKLGKINIKRFADNECWVQFQENIRGRDIFLVQSTISDKHLMELFIMIDAAKRASAERITAVIPYYGYSRQDRKDKPRVPITAKLVADLLTAAGVNRILTIDLHADQIQGYFDIPVDHLFAQKAFIQFIKEKISRNELKIDLKNLVIASPDAGYANTARKYAEGLTANPIAIIDKRRPSHNTSEIHNVIGEVAKKDVLIVDDIIDTGGSLVKAAEAFVKAGAKKVYATCVHPVFSRGAAKRIKNSSIKKLFISDTIKLPTKKGANKIEVFSIAQLLSSAIKEIHEHGSVSGKCFD